MTTFRIASLNSPTEKDKKSEAGYERFQERDIRAKVASDSETLMDAHERLGHQDTSTTKRVYRRGVQNVTTLKPKSKS